MTDCLRLAFMLSMLLVVMLAAALLQPEWADDLGLKEWSWEALRLERSREQERLRKLKKMDEVGFRLWSAKTRVALELLDGRITLFEAAALFRCLSKENPYPAPLLDYRDRPEEERLCLSVIHWTSVAVRERDPAEVEAAVSRFKEDLRRHKEQYGSVQLPSMVADDYLDGLPRKDSKKK